MKCCGKEMYQNVGENNYHCSKCGKRIPILCPTCKARMYDNGNNVHCPKGHYRAFTNGNG